MELLDIGKELKAARESKGISLEKVYEDTRIGLDFLKSLEQGKIEHLTYPVYARGFVRAYAKYLGLDSQKIGNDFSSIFMPEDQFDKINQNNLPTSLKGPRQVLSSRNNALILGVVLALLVFTGLGWFLYSSNTGGPTDLERAALTRDQGPETRFSEPDVQHGPQSPAEMTPERFESAEDLTDPEALAGVVVDEPDADPPQVLYPLQETLASLNAGQMEDAPAERTEVQEEETPDVREAIQPASEKATLVIRAHEDCWLRVTADDSSREAYLRPGESMTVEFERLVQITLGNAGGVNIFVNGAEFPFEASSGQVKTLRIPFPENGSP